MVSPSKVQHPERKQRENNTKETGRNSLTRAQNVPKPKLLEEKTFYLDIKNHALSAKLETRIKEFGGTVEVFLVRNVHIVISDRVDKSGQANSDKRKWGYASGGSGGPPSLRSIEVPTPTPTPPTPYFNADGPLSNSTNLRGQPTQRTKSRADAMLERALIQPQQCSVDPLKNAKNWNIPIWAPEKLQAWLDKIYLSRKDTSNIKQSNQPAQTKNLKVKVLKAPYIKFESYHRDTKPVVFELPSWPTINLDGEPGSCPFASKRRQKKEGSVSKETKENWEATNIVNKEKGKEMTRRPRATATRARRAEQLVAGYCEICRSEYRDLSKHVQSDQHLNFVQNDNNFLSLDTLISTGASVEAFLKLNTSNDVSQDCNLFPNGDHSLRSSVLSEKVDKPAKEDVNNFGVEEIKMVQCNGARRNLNLKLSSPHNLRTRAKHESGHLLRSKGRPWHEVEKSNEKLYDKFEGFTIKKRAKGTIWIEEDDPEDKSEDENIKNVNECNEKVLLDLNKSEFKSHRRSNGHSESNHVIKRESSLIPEIDSKRKKDSSPRMNGHEPNENVSHNAKKDSSFKHSSMKDSSAKHSLVKDSLVKHSSVKDSSVKDSSVKDSSVKDSSVKHSSVKHSSVKDSPTKDLNGEIEKYLSKEDKNGVDLCCNDEEEKDCRGFKTPSQGEKDLKDTKDEKARCSIKLSRRGGRSCRGRPRISIEERLIEDNRAYYKVEVLGSKLRSSAIPPSLNPSPPVKAVKEVVEEMKKDEGPSSEKPVVVRFKRVRKSELSLLSDEAESFMFGEPRRDDSSEASESDQSSVLPKDTESERENTTNSINLSSPCNSSLVKQEVIEDSQDSGNMGRARKKRRTQAEALIKDNADYYKFETPGSRLRYQAPLTGIEDLGNEKPDEEECNDEEDSRDRLLPSKPSPEIEKMQFSFEAIPKSEPWYQTYQRQDVGEEFWHYFSESDAPKPFLLPYEIENFHETLLKRLQRTDGRRRSRGRGSGIGRSPRKSPRCHASTLAIMSTIIRKREQQQHSPSLNIIVEEENQSKSEASSKKELKQKSDVDEDLKEIAKNIDEMLSAKDFQLQDVEDAFEENFLSYTDEIALEETQLPKGAPVNLLELFENCHELVTCLENSSCASSDCGDGNGESPLKRRKRRKNRTGWPGNKLRRKLHTKQMAAYENEKRSEGISQLVAVKEEACERLQAPSSEATSETEVRSSEKRASKSSGSCSFGDCGERRNRSTDTPDRRSQSSEDSKFGKSKDEISSKRDSKGKKESSSEIEDLVCRRDSSKSRKEMSSESEEVFSKRDSSRVKKETSSETEEMSSSKRDSSQTSSKTSEGSSGNDENLKTGKKKIHHLPTSSSDRESLTRKVMRNNVSPRKRNMTKVLIRNRGRRRTAGSSESHVVTFKTKCLSRRMQKMSRKRPGGRASSPLVLDSENCKKKSYVNISPRTRLRRVRDGISSDAGDVDCALSERVNSPVAAPTDLQNRRSSIEFQPVVRVMKIEDQVDRDHSILSVKVASNRRLRSSGSSPKASQPPKKRYKSGRGHFSSWLKTS